MYGTYERLGVHVFASAKEVIRAAQTKLAPAAFTLEHRQRRKEFYKIMLRYHKEAQELVRGWRL